MSTIFYDGNCGICSYIMRESRFLLSYGFKTVSLLDESAKDIVGKFGTGDILLKSKDGNIVVGADVYRAIFKKIWWLFPLYIFSRIPILSSIFNLTYRIFADHRHLISDKCKIK